MKPPASPNFIHRLTARPRLSRSALLVITAAWIALLPNLATLKRFATAPAAGEGLKWLTFTLGGVVATFTVTLLLLTVLSLFFWGRTLKWLCALAVIAAAALGYFSFTIGMLFERSMFANLIQTHRAEALELVTPSLIAWNLVIGILPAWWILRARLAPVQSWARGVGRAVALIVVPLIVTALFVYPQYQRYASAARSKSITFDTVAPANFVTAALAHGYTVYSTSGPRTPVGQDAASRYAMKKPRLIVFVLGETARAQNHGLNGYERDTTPRLKSMSDVLYFPNSLACGTATTISVPCIFSGIGRDKFSMFTVRNRETLVDVVRHAGGQVLWLDNDGGCKDVCKAAEYIDLTDANHEKWCEAGSLGNCFDDLLLDGLEARLRARASSTDQLLVLHIKGSHGPAYYKRYPKAFERFTPTCQSSELASCPPEHLRNAYDNTIVYTDHILAETISVLQKLSDRYATAMIYASDHGESLGENGLYLHGLPNAVAPDVQTQVPMLAWLSPQFVEMERWDGACVRAQAGKPRSHDDIFSTVLGMLEIQTTAYDKARDIFAGCDRDDTPAHIAGKLVQRAN